jgi:protein-tyrosine phosphatase
MVRNRARGTLERGLHGLRRHSARRRVAERSPASVLFVCEGNIYRSPYGAAILAASVVERTGLRIGSGGFVGPDRTSPPEAQALARCRGIDLSKHRSRLIDAAMLQDYELIVVMEARQARLVRKRFNIPAQRLMVLGDLDPEAGGGRTIVDPWSSPAELLEGSYRRVERCVLELAALLASTAPSTTAATSSRAPSGSS